MVKTGNESLLGNFMSTYGNICYESLLCSNAVFKAKLLFGIGA